MSRLIGVRWVSASFNDVVLVMNHTDLPFCRILSQSLCDDRGEIQAITYLDRHITKDLHFREPVNTINDRISIIARPFLIASQNQSASSIQIQSSRKRWKNQSIQSYSCKPKKSKGYNYNHKTSPIQTRNSIAHACHLIRLLLSKLRRRF